MANFFDQFEDTPTASPTVAVPETPVVPEIDNGAPRAEGFNPEQMRQLQELMTGRQPIPMFDEANPNPSLVGTAVPIAPEPLSSPIADQANFFSQFEDAVVPVVNQAAPDNFFNDIDQSPEKLDNANPIIDFVAESIQNVVGARELVRSQGLALQRGVGQIGGGVLKSSAEAAGALGLIDSPEETAAFRLGEAIEETFDPNPNDIKPGFFSEDLPGAIGTTIGFAAGGAIGTAVKLPAMATTILVPSVLGAAVGADELYTDARNNGATDEQAYQAYVSGLGFGASEGLPISRLLGRLDSATGGGVKKVLTEGVKGGIEELTQEVFQQWGGNITASDIAGYDPDRSAIDNLGQAAKVGGGAGFLLSTLAAAMGVRMRNPPTDEEVRKAQTARLKELSERIDEAETEAGAAPTPTVRPEQRLVNTLKGRVDELDLKRTEIEGRYRDTLAQLGEQDLTQVNEGGRARFNPQGVSPSDRQMDIHPWHMSQNQIFTAINNSLKPGISKEPRMGEEEELAIMFEIGRLSDTLTELDDFEKGIAADPPQRFGTNFESVTEEEFPDLFLAARTELNSLKAGLRKQLTQAARQGFVDAAGFLQSDQQVITTGFQGLTGTEGGGDAIDLQKQLAKYPALLEKLEKEGKIKKGDLGKTFLDTTVNLKGIQPEVAQEIFDRINLAEQQMAQVGGDTVRKWAKSFLPADVKVIFSDGSISRELNAARGEVQPKGIDRDTNGWMYLATPKLVVLEVNSPNFINGFMGGLLPQSQVSEGKKSFFGVLAHEFGHSLAATRLNEAPQEVRDAIYAEYESHLEEAVKGTDLKQFAEKWYRPEKASQIIEATNEKLAQAEELEQEVAELERLTVEAEARGDLKEAKRLKIAADPKRYKAKKIRKTVGSPTDYINSYRSGASYVLNFDEYFADQISRAMQNRLSGDLRVSGFFKNLAKDLKRFYDKVVKRFAPTQTVDDFLELALTQNQLTNTRKELADRIRESGLQPTVEEQIMETVRKTQAGPKKPGPPVEGNREEPTPKEVGEDLDTYNRGIKLTFTLTQLVKVNPHIQSLRTYVEEVRKWWNTKLTWVARADERLKEWQQLSGNEGRDFARFLFEMTLKSDELKRALTIEESAELSEKHNFTDDMYSLLDGVQADMQSTLDALEGLLLRDSAKANVDNVEAGIQDAQRIQAEMAVLRNRDFFPLSRFGKFQVMVKADRAMVYEGKSYKIGEVISFEMFESERDKNKHFAKLKKELGNDFRVSAGKLADDTSGFHGMPPQLISRVESLFTQEEKEGGGTEESRRKLQEFRDLVQKLSPAQSFKRHLMNRAGTKGFNTDAMRGYADYFARFANHIARIEHYGKIQDQIAEVRKSGTLLQAQGKDSSKRDKIADHLDKHSDYIMNPKNEFANIRAIGFIWYLGFVPKSAVVNLTQIPLVAYPHLAAKFGDKNAVRELGRSFKTVKQIMLGQHERIEPELREALSRGVVDGFLDESLATELAAIAEGSTLQRYTAGSFLGSEAAQQKIRQYSSYGAYMFQSAEKMNRRATFVASYRLGVQKGLTGEAAYISARDSVETTQYEYARWNRADFMRGRRSVVFLFWQYLQNTLFFALGGDKGAVRFWMMMLFMGGVGGLPFAENVMDLWNFAAKQLAKTLDWEDPVVNVQQEIRELVQQLGMNPDLIMHGASRYTFGWPQIESLGVDGFSGFDLSGSISMGDIIPGVSSFTSDGRTSDKFMSSTTDLAGAAISIPISIFRAINDDNPDGFKRWERAYPTAARNASRGWEMFSKGEVEGRKGETLQKFDVNDPFQMVEIIGQTAGFTPERLAQRKESDWVAREAVQYWETRRRILMKQMDWAQSHNDKEAIKGVNKAWARFNRQVPRPELGISPKDMRTSLKSQAKGRFFAEEQVPQSRRYRGIVEEVREAFPPPKAPLESEGNFFDQFQ